MKGDEVKFISRLVYLHYTYRVRTLHFSKYLIVKGTISSLAKKKKKRWTIISVACENSGKTIAFHVDHGSPSRRLLHGLINKDYQTGHNPQKFLKKLLCHT